MRALERAARLLVWVAAAFLVTMMMLVVADVALRGLFGIPIRGSVELVELLLACTFFIALPAAFLRDDHLMVDMVDHWWPRVVPGLKRFAALIAIPVLVTMAWQGWKVAADVVELGDVTSDLSLPRVLYWIPVLFGMIGAAVAALVLALRR